MHVHSIYATVLATLKNPRLPPIEQNSTLFYDRVAVDSNYGGLALDEEAERACSLLADPTKNVLLMGNHGIMVIGPTVAETFHRLYSFERACEIYIKALWTQEPLLELSHDIAEKACREFEQYPGYADAHLRELKLILDEEGSTYAN
jgi:ribulose-5-phosphate 4-epimerase/fuculose-1-phosphate aldolase